MQNKRDKGFEEDSRILKPNGNAIYTISIVEGDDNTKKWYKLMKKDCEEYFVTIFCEFVTEKD